MTLLKAIDKPGEPSAVDPAHNIWKQRRSSLDAFFNPKSVAVIGATEKRGSVGRTLLSNLVGQPFGGTVFPVNPHAKSVLGVRAYKDIASVPEKTDLAVIATPAKTVPGVVRECVAAGVGAAVVISAGFKELGAPGCELEEEIMRHARGKMRIIGPNCLGVMNPPLGFNATFASRLASPGNVAFISQSGALCTAILDWSFRAHVGFSAFASIGSMLDVGWGDLIDYLGEDEKTRSILLYMETIGDARSFLSAAREVALAKPIIVLKAGKTDAAAKAAASHTGSIAGSDKALDAAFDRCGVLRVDRIEDLFEMAEVLAKQPRPRGPRLSIVTNAGGPGVLTTDSFIADGGTLSDLSAKTLSSLDALLPSHWSHANPIDILGDAGPDRYAKTLEVVAGDEETDGILVILTPQAMSDPTATAQELAAARKGGSKPVLASWMGGEEVEKGREILTGAGIPVFDYPDRAARLFHYMWKYSHNLDCLYKTPAPAYDDAGNEGLDVRVCERVISSAAARRRTVLTEAESKRLLSAYGIPVVETEVAANEAEAVRAAERLGYPVAVKLNSETLTHKTDVGGVRLNLTDAEAVRGAFRLIESSVREKAGAGHFLGVTVQRMVRRDGIELIVGSTNDAQLGPVLLFGAGGSLVELFDDHPLGLPPLNSTLARRLVDQAKISRALKGVRGRGPVDFAALEKILVRFSRLVVEQRRLREVEINPLLASPDGFIALDARAIVYSDDEWVKGVPRLAIRPYPGEYVSSWTAKDGTRVTIRPIRPEDEPLVVKFHHTLSDESVRRRYFMPLNLDERIAHERLVRVCYNDYDRDIALVADRRDDATGAHEIMGVGRLSREHGDEAEFAVVVSDRYHNQGVGSRLLELVVEVARREGVSVLKAEIHPDNAAMQHVSRKLGFVVTPGGPDGRLVAALVLSGRGRGAAPA